MRSLDVFRSPPLGDREQAVIDRIQVLRAELGVRVATPRRWAGTLRRMTFARNVQGSNEIEGYNATMDDAAAVVDHEPTIDADRETELALAGYRDAMTYILQIAHDDQRIIHPELLKALHFMMLKHELDKSPGLWRLRPVQVVREPDGTTVYEGPPWEAVPPLMDAALHDLATDDGPVLVRAAMAHLNLVMIHPFRDGNGRMARALQTLVLAQDGILAPVFSSIEEYLGRNTRAYYDVLALVGEGHWSPRNDARPWVRFCLTAHFRQATTLKRRIDEAEGLWRQCAQLAEDRGLPERTIGPLVEAALGFRIRNATYRTIVEITLGEEVSFQTASRDLQRLVTAGYLTAVGDRRSRHYFATEQLGDVRRAIRAQSPSRRNDDPFDSDAPHPQQLTL